MSGVSCSGGIHMVCVFCDTELATFMFREYSSVESAIGPCYHHSVFVLNGSYYVPLLLPNFHIDTTLFLTPMSCRCT